MLILPVWFQACDRNPRVFIENASPPRFTISGSGVFRYLEITGPDLVRDPQNRTGQKDYLPTSQKYWKLVPKDPNQEVSLDAIGPVTYGQVPNNLRQEFPETGLPAPLIEGDLYNVHLEPIGSYSFNIFFSMRDGKVLAVTQR